MWVVNRTYTELDIYGQRWMHHETGGPDDES